MNNISYLIIFVVTKPGNIYTKVICNFKCKSGVKGNFVILKLYCINLQNAFARKKLQNSNALWAQKLSGCTMHTVTIISMEFCSILTQQSQILGNIASARTFFRIEFLAK